VADYVSSAWIRRASRCDGIMNQTVEDAVGNVDRDLLMPVRNGNWEVRMVERVW